MAYIGNRPEQGNFRKCDAITTSATATYNLLVGGVAVNPNQNQCIVSLNGVIQSSGNSYTIASSQITFASALTSSDVIDFILILGDTLDAGIPSDDSVGLAQLSASGSPSSSNYLRGDNSWQTVSAGTSLSGSTDNQVTTVTGANAIQGETNFIYNGTIVGCGADGANADLGVGLHVRTGDSGGDVHNDADELVIEQAGAHVGMTFLNSGDNKQTINFGDDSDNNVGQIEYDHSGNTMKLVANTGTALRLTDGTAKFFTTTDFGGTRCHIKGNFYAQRGLGLNSSDGASSGNQVNMVYFGVENSAQGSITAGAGSVVYNTSSDYRRKENVSNLTGAIDRVKQFKPYRFNFTDDPSKKVTDGFFAHEVTSIVPQAVTGEKDAIEKYREGQDIPEGKSVGDNILDEEGNTIPDYQGIDHSKLVPLLTSALQEAITKIETLETKVTALENA